MHFVPQLLVQIIFFILINPSSKKEEKIPVTQCNNTDKLWLHILLGNVPQLTKVTVGCPSAPSESHCDNSSAAQMKEKRISVPSIHLC